ncbi:hypothetical protein DIPPA_12982 [Diplonema papillatum]|nr:hypothetical protein DIPPA_12982 [Diplonema papillatum]
MAHHHHASYSYGSLGSLGCPGQNAPRRGGCAGYLAGGSEGSCSPCVSPYPDRVSTPWIRNLSLDHGIPLGAEVLAFGSFLRPTADEQARSLRLRRVLQAAVAASCCHSTVKLIGSAGIGVALPHSGTDLVVEGWTGTEQQVLDVLLRVQDASWPHTVAVPSLFSGGAIGGGFDAHGTMTVVFRNAEGDLNDNRVVFSKGASAERKLVLNLRKRLDAFDGAVRAVAFVVRTILSQSKLDGDAHGGLSGVAVGLMVASVAASVIPTSPPPAHVIASVVLKETLRIFSKWDWARKSVMLVGYSEHKTHDGAPVSICTPFSSVTNLAERCYRQVQISAMFRYGWLGLSQWDTAELPDGMKNSRGVTPLSSLIAHKDLWDRSHLIRRQFPDHPSSSDLSSSLPSSEPRLFSHLCSSQPTKASHPELSSSLCSELSCDAVASTLSR